MCGHFAFFSFSDELGRHLRGFLGVFPATVKEETRGKVSTHTSSLLPFIFSRSSDQTRLTAVVDMVPSVVADTGVCCKRELNLRPLSVSTGHEAPCRVKNAFALFSGPHVLMWF